ncbi:phosphate/phosphite/phosphonate ABC transporter substrate-binding protein [Thiomicrorhabdus chilensis]|uniref:phosphate/phosphite/phosphonate ABC transporter substrate-binding protein n=1 Tax=Thiomicrorhabdus chilensis TaxID=63656 RepID=UPI0004151765|nr:PhnD/SsuA/transferrin family substrate-binding protein [Thiomicrorhabdus chilensis]
MQRLLLVLFIGIQSLLTGCSSKSEADHSPVFIEPTETVHEYTFAVHPLHNPVRLFEVFNPLMQYLNQHIADAHFKIEASRNYQAFDNKLKHEAVEFALPNPYQTLIAIEHNYRVIAKMADDEQFKGIILVRKDSFIKQPSDLKGRAISYPAPTALAATMLPQDFLHKHGVNIQKDVDNRYVGSQESSIMNVYRGNTAAGATWPPPWKALSEERPQLKNELKVIWQTQHLVNNSIVARKDVPEALTQQVRELLANLHTTQEGREILAKMHLSRYELADNQSYQTVKDFIEQFGQTVRPL